MNILEVDSVQKAFGNRSVLTDIYLKCQTGEIIGLLGRNGTGKSTLMKIIFGTLPTIDKFIAINGKKYDRPFKTNGAIAYLPQHNFLLSNITVNKTAGIFISKDTITDFFDDEMLCGIKENKVSELSGGQLRYLEIKLLLHSNHKFVLLDEPFNGVAPIIIERLKVMIRRQSATKGIILTDHDYNNVLDVTNKLYLLFDGGIKPISSRNDLVEYGYLNA